MLKLKLIQFSVMTSPVIQLLRNHFYLARFLATELESKIFISGHIVINNTIFKNNLYKSTNPNVDVSL